MIGSTSGIEQEAPQEEQVQEQEVNQTEQELDNLLVQLEGKKNAPDIFQLEAWKDIHGVFYVSSVLGDDDIYIWKVIKRLEYKQIIKMGNTDKLSYQELIVRKALLFPAPRPDYIANSPAGVVETLFNQIMYQSGFVSEEQALSLVKVI